MECNLHGSTPCHNGEVIKGVTECIDCGRKIGYFYRFDRSGHVGCLVCSQTWQHRSSPEREVEF